MLTEAGALLTLLRHGTRPVREYVELAEDLGSARQVLAQEGLVGLDSTAAEAEIDGWRRQGLELITLLDTRYPQNLRAVHDRPPFLFVAGGLRPEDSRSIAVIGGRKPSPSGLNTAVVIASQLSSSGFTIVSGLAAGIDTAAHKAALAKGGRTVAVIGTGLKHAYPRQNESLQREIARRGVVLSQFWPDDRPTRSTFPQRNATMSGLTLGTVIVEASETSGTRIQARRALQHGRPVFLLQRLPERLRWARELARAPGVHVIQSADEVSSTIDRLTASGALAG